MTGTAAIVTWRVLLAGCGDPEPLHVAGVGGAGAPLGALLAAENINAAGGVRGRLLEVDIVNEGPAETPQQAIATAESLGAHRRILAVVGHGGSGTSLAVSQVFNARRDRNFNCPGPYLQRWDGGARSGGLRASSGVPRSGIAGGGGGAGGQAERRRAAGAAQMVENPVDHGALRDECDDPHLGPALREPERIGLEDLPQELGPAPPRLAEWERD